MRAFRTAVFVSVFAALAPLAVHARALAQQVLFQVDPSVSPELAQHLGGVLANVGAVVSADTAPNRGDIAVGVTFATGADGSWAVRVTYYDAVSAAPLASDDLALRDGELKPSADRALVKGAQNALAMVAPNTDVARGPVPAAPEEGVAADASAVEPAEDASDSERSVAAVFGVGAGVGMYGDELPRAVGSSRVPASLFPAFDVAFGVDGVTRDGKLTPGLHAAYFSSIGYTLTNTEPDGTKISSAARTHQLRVDAAINVNFGDSRSDVSLPIRLGYAWSNLRTDVELPYVYRHTLSGPQLGLRLRLPLADDSVVLLFGPDAWFLLQVSDRIRRAGLDASGFAFGGEAELLVRIGQRFALRAMWRETHASVSSEKFARSFSAMQRFITIGVAATY